MIYQYIFGRNENGYETIKCNDDGKYTSDNKILKSFDFQFIPPDNCNINFYPEPIMFLNNPNLKPIAVIGKERIISNFRNSNLFHYYIFDINEKDNLYKNTEILFCLNKYVATLGEARNWDIDSPNYFTTSLKANWDNISKLSGLDKEMLKTILFGCFEVSSKDNCIYIINKSSYKEFVETNFLVMQILYNMLPWQLIEKLGFITYFKFINPSEMNSLNTNIKIRFVEDNNDNNAAIPSEVAKGNVIVNAKTGYQSISDFSSEFLNYLVATINHTKNKENLDEFYFFLENCIEDYSNTSFVLIESIFHYWNKSVLSIEQEVVDCQALIKNNKILSSKFNIESKVRISKILENVIVSGAYNDLILEAYNSISEMREYIIHALCKKISEDALNNSTETLKIMENSKTSNEFLENLRKNLISNKNYVDGGLLFIEQSLKNLSENKDNLNERIIKIVTMFLQLGELSTDIFDNIYVEHYLDTYIYEGIIKADLASFENYIYKLDQLINMTNNEKGKQNFIDLYCKSSIVYLESSITKLQKNKTESKKIITDFFYINKIISKNENISLDNKYVKYFNDTFSKIFEDSPENTKDFYYFLDCIKECTEKNPNAFFMWQTASILMNKVFNEQKNNDLLFEELYKWPEEYIRLSGNRNLINKIETAKSIENFKKHLENGDLKNIKLSLKEAINTNEFSDASLCLVELSTQWIENLDEKNKIFKDKQFDFSILPYIFKDDLIKIIKYLPKDKINAWVDCMTIIRNEIKFSTTTTNLNRKVCYEITNNKKLLHEFKNLKENQQFIFGEDIINMFGIGNPIAEPQSNNIKTEENKRKPKQEVGFFFSLSGVFCITIILYLVLIIINNLIQTKSALFTAIYILFTGCFVLILYIKGVMIKRSKLYKINLLVSVIIIFVLAIINFIVITTDYPNSKNSFLNVYKNIFSIRYDFEAPTITIKKVEIIDNITNENIKIDDISKNVLEIDETKSLLIEIDSVDNNNYCTVKAFVNEIEIPIKENKILLNMSEFPKTEFILKVVSVDDYKNESQKEIVINNKEIDKSINIILTGNKSFLKNEDVVTLNFDELTEMELTEDETLNIEIEANSIVDSNVSIFVNNDTKKVNKENIKISLGKSDFVVGENILKISAKTIYGEKSVEIKINFKNVKE